MTKPWIFALGLAFSLVLALPGAAAEAKIGYVGLKDDVRYHPVIAYTRIQISPEKKPVEGARLAIGDMKVVTDTIGLTLSLDEQMVTDIASATASVQAMAAAGERFALLDLPGDMVEQVAVATKDLPITLINTTAPDDRLRALCLPNLMHTGASDRMVADAYVQFLRHSNWTKILMLVGQEPRDIALADAFQAAAKRFSLNIVDRRTFSMSTDANNRESNNPKLLTGRTDYDVIYIADTLGDYARRLPYRTQLARPLIGSEGLLAAEWHWSLDKDSATQVTLRFQRAAEGGREMSGQDWSTWIAVKSIATAYAKARSEDPAAIDAFLKSSRFRVDGSKGYKLNFRAWDLQMRMPIPLTTHNAPIDEAPFPEFLHQTNVLDTLGVDEPEHKCL